jgi:hypothetical protein
VRAIVEHGDEMMTTSHKRSIIGSVFAVCLIFSSSCTRHDVLPSSILNTIPKPKVDAYSKVCDASQWKNPYLVVRPRGVEILGMDGLVSPNNLETVLGALPKTAWPYGRIVAVQELGIRSGDDDQLITEVLNDVLSTLKTLEIEVSRWPSA